MQSDDDGHYCCQVNALFNSILRIVFFYVGFFFVGFFLNSNKLPLPPEVYNNYSINCSLMPQREERHSCKKEQKILCQAEHKVQIIYLSQYLACFQKEQRKAAPHEECLAALQQCKRAL